MSLADDLLDLAELLANTGSPQLEQASLRRSISTCYYALFHLLLEDASRSVAIQFDIPGVQARILRSITHKDLKTVSNSFISNNNLPILIKSLMNSHKSDTNEIVRIAKIVCRLQETREEADYETETNFTRTEVAALIKSTKDAFQAWAHVREKPLGRAYLFYLLYPKLISGASR